MLLREGSIILFLLIITTSLCSAQCDYLPYDSSGFEISYSSVTLLDTDEDASTFMLGASFAENGLGDITIGIGKTEDIEIGALGIRRNLIKQGRHRVPFSFAFSATGLIVDFFNNETTQALVGVGSGVYSNIPISDRVTWQPWAEISYNNGTDLAEGYMAYGGGMALFVRSERKIALRLEAGYTLADYDIWEDVYSFGLVLGIIFID